MKEILKFPLLCPIPGYSIRDGGCRKMIANEHTHLPDKGIHHLVASNLKVTFNPLLKKRITLHRFKYKIMWSLTRNLPFIIAAIFIVAGAEIFSAWTENSGDGVAVITDRLQYRQGEVIKIIFTNNLNESVFSHIRSMTPVFCITQIEKKTTDDQWEKLDAYCKYPSCKFDIDAPGEIKPGKSVALEWNPFVFEHGTSRSSLLKAGLYRLEISYMKSLKRKWQSVYTNTFTIISGRKK